MFNKNEKSSLKSIVFLSLAGMLLFSGLLFFKINAGYQRYHIESNADNLFVKNPITLGKVLSSRNTLKLYHESGIQYYAIAYLTHANLNREELASFIYEDLNPKDQKVFELLHKKIATGMDVNPKLKTYIEERYTENSSINNFNDYSWEVVCQYIRNGLSYDS